MDLSDDEEEGVWKITETGELLAVVEKTRPDRFSEHKYENWRPGQPNGGRFENAIYFDAYYSTGQGWVDCPYWGPPTHAIPYTCQVGKSVNLTLNISFSGGAIPTADT